MDVIGLSRNQLNYDICAKIYLEINTALCVNLRHGLIRLTGYVREGGWLVVARNDRNGPHFSLSPSADDAFVGKFASSS